MKDADIDSLKKINVRQAEGLRYEIPEKVPIPELWAGMKYNKKLTFKIAGVGLNAIARR